MSSAEPFEENASQTSVASGRQQEVALPENARLVLQVAPNEGDPKSGSQMSPGNGAGTSPNFDSNAIESKSNPSAYVRDVRGAFSSVPKVKPQWLDRYMKIMVVGEAGMGKTTFIQNLFAAYAQDPNLKVASVPGPTSRQVFETNPQQLCTTIDVSDETNQTRYHYAVQDTPGWDSLDDTMQPILDHIQACHLKCLENEQDARRLGPMHKSPDTRVDVALYFISPHRIKLADIKFMASLSEAVPVIPILAKADCMTSSELESFRGQVRDALTTAKREHGHEVMYEFSEEALAESHPVHAVPPFAIVSSRQMDPSVGRYWPVRRYPWGTCEALSSEHSDVAALKKLLLEISFEEFKDKTEARYYVFRENELLNLHDDNDRTRKIKPRFILNRERPHRLPIKLLRIVAGIVITYAAGAAVLGGRQRLEGDAELAKQKAEQLAETAAEIAGNTKQYVDEKLNPPPPPRKKFLGIF